MPNNEMPGVENSFLGTDLESNRSEIVGLGDKNREVAGKPLDLEKTAGTVEILLEMISGKSKNQIDLSLPLMALDRVSTAVAAAGGADMLWGYFLENTKSDLEETSAGKKIENATQKIAGAADRLDVLKNKIFSGRGAGKSGGIAF